MATHVEDYSKIVINEADSLIKIIQFSSRSVGKTTSRDHSRTRFRFNTHFELRTLFASPLPGVVSRPYP